MSDISFQIDSGPADARHRLILAHGAGAGIESPFMEAITQLLNERAIAVTRFEFAYMAARRNGGKRRPPPKAELLLKEYADFLNACAAKKAAKQKLVIGGKSLGGRIASMIANNQFEARKIIGLVCLGYPFHAPATPEKLRTGHLEHIACPTLIVQGTRDPFGTQAEVETLSLAPSIEYHWIGDGDHDFGPRGASGFTRKGNLADAADAVAGFLQRLS